MFQGSYQPLKVTEPKTIINMINEGIEEDVIIRICPEFTRRN